MKNFKKVIAFLMVAAMTLGMGTIAFAEEKSEAPISVTPVQAASAGDTVMIQIKTAKDMSFSAGNLVIDFNEEKVASLSNEDLMAIPGNVNERGKYNVWKLPFLGAPNAVASGYPDDEDRFVENYFNCLWAEYNDAWLDAGTTMLELYVLLKEDITAGDSLGVVFSPSGITDNDNGDVYKYADIDITVVAASSSSSSSSSSSQKTSAKTTGKTTGKTTAKTTTKGADATTTTKGADVTTTSKKAIETPKDAFDSMDTLENAVNAVEKLDKSKFATETDYNNVQTAKAEAEKVLKNPNATAAEKTAALNALKATTVIAELDTVDEAVNVAKKLDKAAFASDADYQAFQTALAEAQKVLSNQNATAEQKAAALATLKAAMDKASDIAIINAFNVVNAPAAVAPTTAGGSNGKAKMGDAAPVAALLIVAIAAFGTAVVVYRKKVNA